jgi:hypothetical protein
VLDSYGERENTRRDHVRELRRLLEYREFVFLDPGVITQGLFYLAWLTDHRAEFEALVRDRLGVPAAAQVLWSAPRLICVAEDFTRYDRHAVGEIRRCIDLVRYRFFGAGLLGLEPVVTAAGRDRSPGAGPAWTGRMPKAQPAEDAIGELRDALDEVLCLWARTCGGSSASSTGPIAGCATSPASAAASAVTEVELVMSLGRSGGSDAQAGLGEAAVYEVAAVLDAAEAVTNGVDEVFGGAEGDVGEPAAPQQ